MTCQRVSNCISKYVSEYVSPAFSHFIHFVKVHTNLLSPIEKSFIRNFEKATNVSEKDFEYSNKEDYEKIQSYKDIRFHTFLNGIDLRNVTSTDLRETISYLMNSTVSISQNPEYVLTVKGESPECNLLYATKVSDTIHIWQGEGIVQLFSQLDKVSTDNQFTSFILNSQTIGNTRYRLVDTTLHPHKSNPTDAGFDLNLVRLVKIENGVEYYSTGVILDPPPLMWYMLVARSSMAKSGYVLANGIGIIDSGYRGEIIVALRKVNTESPAIELPARWVQVVPMQWFNTQMVQNSCVSSSVRSDTGGLGSRQFNVNVPLWEQYIDSINN